MPEEVCGETHRVRLALRENLRGALNKLNQKINK